MSDQNIIGDNNTVYWSPKAEVTVNGAELAILFQVVDLQHIDFSSLSFSKVKEIFEIANQAKEVIVGRMNEQGLLSNSPIIESQD